MNFKKHIKICAAAVAASLCMTPVAAQVQTEKHSAALLYGAAIPVSNGFAEKAGFLNVSAEYGFRLMPVLTVGVSVGYGFYRDEGNVNLSYDGDLVSGFSDRKLSAIPVLAQLTFSPLHRSRLQPYIIIGAGVQYAKFDIVGDQIDKRTKSDWAAAYSPQAGVRFFPDTERRFYIDARVSWNYAGNEWELMDVRSIRRTGISLGAGMVF